MTQIDDIPLPRRQIYKLVEESDLKVHEIAERAGFTRDYLQKLKRGDKSPRINEENLEQLAKVFNKYPSELLPIEWQKPAEINIDILKKSLQTILNVGEELNAKLPVDSMATVVSLLYQHQITNPEITNLEFERDASLLLKREKMERKQTNITTS